MKKQTINFTFNINNEIRQKFREKLLLTNVNKSRLFRRWIEEILDTGKTELTPKVLAYSKFQVPLKSLEILKNSQQNDPPKKYGFEMSPDLYRRFKLYCKAHGISKSAFMRSLIEKYLEE